MQKSKFDGNRHSRADQYKPTPEQIEAGKAAKNEYYKRYRAKNRDKIREIQRRYRAKNRDKIREIDRRYWARQATKETETAEL